MVYVQKNIQHRFATDTQTGEDYPVYRRQNVDNGGQITTMSIREERKKGRSVTIDNKWIVPYSLILCRTFNAHLEYCHSVQAIKYICKYINKGSDQATFGMKNAHDEVDNYLNGQFINISEAVWRLLEFPIHDRHPSVSCTFRKQPKSILFTRHCSKYSGKSTKKNSDRIL